VSTGFGVHEATERRKRKQPDTEVPGYSFASSKTRLLKLNPSLNLNHSPGQAPLGATEERVLHLCAWAVEVERL
jgi:hypothetical protein